MKLYLFLIIALVSKSILANPGEGFLSTFDPITGKFVPSSQFGLVQYALEPLPTLNFTSVKSNMDYQFKTQLDRQMTQIQISKNKQEYTTTLKSVFPTESALQNGSEIVRRIRAVCRHAIKNDVYLETTKLDSELCNLPLVNPIEACSLDRAISQENFDKFIADLRSKATAESSPLELRSACEDELRNRWSDNSQGQFVPDISSAAAVYEKLQKNTWNEAVFKLKPKYEMTAQEARLFANKCHGGNLDDCDDFPPQILEKSLADLARLYVVAAPQMGGGFLFFRKKTCDDCFPEKFAALSKGEPENRDAQTEFRKKNADDYLAYVERKVNDKVVAAYSEYAKHIDRKNALKTMLGISSGSEQGDACSSGDSLVVYLANQAKSRSGCVAPPELQQRIAKVSEKMFGGRYPAPGSPDQFMTNIVTSIKDETFEYNNPLCRNKATPRSGFDRVRAADFKMEYINILNDVRTDEESKREIGKCGEKEQKCLVGVLKEYLMRKLNHSEESAESLIQRKYLGNPYLRLLIQSRQGWTSASRLKTDQDVIKNFTENRQHLLDLAKQDSEEQCNSLLKDVASALCMKPENAMAMVSPAKMRSELQDEIDRIAASEEDPTEKNLQLLSVMGMACKAMDMNPEMDMDSTSTSFISDKSADVQNLADPVLRRSMAENPIGAKQADEFHVYTETLCDPSNSVDKPIFPEQTNRHGGSRLKALNGINRSSPFQLHSDLSISDIRAEVPTELYSLPNSPRISGISLQPINDPNEVVVTGTFPNGHIGRGTNLGSGLGSDCTFDITCEKKIDVGQSRTTLPSDGEVDRSERVYSVIGLVERGPLTTPTIILPKSIPTPIDLSLKSLAGTSSQLKTESSNDPKVGAGTEKSVEVQVSKSEQGAITSEGSEVIDAGIAREGARTADVDDVSGVEMTSSGEQNTGKAQVGPGGKTVPGSSTYGGNFRSIASSGGIISEEGNRFNINYNRRADYGSLESSESKQTNAELEMMKMLSQTQLQSLQMQRQVSEMRLEMERLRQSTADAMAKASEIRTTTPKAKKNAFDTPPAATSEEPVVAEEEVEEDVPAPVKPKTPKQPAGQTASNKPLSSDFAVPENFGSLAPTGSRKPSGGGSSGNSVSGGGNSGPVGGTRSVGIVTGGGLGATSSVGSVINSAGGSRSSNFAPSLTLQESITPTTTVEAIPQERKVELLKEFLGYVERNPGYQDGRYLNNANSQVVIDFQGRSLVVKVEDISDADLRAQLQERLLRQRVLLNQFVRSKRLATLQRLLAESRGGATP